MTHEEFCAWANHIFRWAFAAQVIRDSKTFTDERVRYGFACCLYMYKDGWKMDFGGFKAPHPAEFSGENKFYIRYPNVDISAPFADLTEARLESRAAAIRCAPNMIHILKGKNAPVLIEMEQAG